MVSLPDLTGKTTEEAESILLKKKLLLINSGMELHENMEKGKIISQDPLPGSRIKINKVVKVMLSAGKEKIVVPDFIGRSLQSVSQQLNTIALRKGKIAHVHTPAYAAGKIIAQSPIPNDEVGRGSKINFLVSQGDREKKYLMPDLIGKRAKRAIRILKEMEFIVGHIRYSFYPGLEPGYIINQYPEPGSRIQRRNLITLEVSK
ncbi:MAG: PASTA domain-containing protein [Candidatus Aminicenantes bacterium]|nr:PASTA domain-containing protein [Candidatus Aminicenantes bacterium]